MKDKKQKIANNSFEKFRKYYIIENSVCLREVSTFGTRKICSTSNK